MTNHRSDVVARMTATRVRRVLLASLTAVLIVLFGLALVIGQRRAEAAARRSDATLTDVREIEAFVTAVTALENRQREYLMTGDGLFLVEYGIARQEVDTRLAQVRDIIARHHGSDGVTTLDRLVGARIAALDSGVVLAREVSNAAARSFVAEGDGPQIMRDIRAYLTEHEQEQIDALAASTAEERRRAGWLLALIVGGSVLALVATVGTDVSFERALRRAEETSADLEDLNAQLEEHTADLESANARLNAQSADLEAQAVELEELVETLAENEERFHALTDYAADLTFVIDREGTLTYVSKAVERVLGHAPERLVGTSVFDIVHVGDDSIVQSALDRLIREPGGIGEVEVRLSHATDGWRIVAARASSLLDVPSVAGIVVNAHDVTDRRAMEVQLRQSQKMEAVGRLTAGIAHDFNNLLTAINGYSSFALTETTDDDVRQDLKEVVAAAGRASALTRQLLAFSRQQVLRPRLIEPNQVITEMQPLIRRTLGEDVRLSTHLADDAGPVLADPMQIEQVLLNLAVNARDAMPHGGQLSIETRAVDADAQPMPSANARGWVVITVTDTGQGMPPEVRERIFEPFFTTKPSGQGTGLGLSTVYGIVQQNGGDINVYSEPDHGTVFKILLPIADATSEEAAAVRWRGAADTQPPSVAPARGDGRTVVVVEDDPSVRGFVKRGLEELGYVVLAPPEPEGALDLLRDPAIHIDLLATDVIMPRVSGSAIADEARARRPGLPVLFVSGYTYNQVLERGVLPADVNFLEKPFSIEALAREIARLIRDTDPGPATPMPVA